MKDNQSIDNELIQKINELEKRTDFFHLVADNSVDWELFRDTKGKILYCNQSFERITGYSVNDFVNGKIGEKEIVHPDDWNYVFNQMQETIKTNKPEKDFEFRGS